MLLFDVMIIIMIECCWWNVLLSNIYILNFYITTDQFIRQKLNPITNITNIYEIISDLINMTNGYTVYVFIMPCNGTWQRSYFYTFNLSTKAWLITKWVKMSRWRCLMINRNSKTWELKNHQNPIYHTYFIWLQFEDMIWSDILNLIEKVE